MAKSIDGAIQQMRERNEAGLNYIYSQTYNFVYLRAKTILSGEEEIKNLMTQIYHQAYDSADGLSKENLYEWLGKKTYILGRQSFRKKKAREMQFLEIEKDELQLKGEHTEIGKDVICKALEQLPDLYHATVFAFYFDYMRVEEIAEVMDCPTGAIINRLNYARKYIQKSIENYYEEKGKDLKIKINFSVETLRNVLSKWTVDNCMGITSAQSVYYNICKELKLQAGSVYIEGKEFAGVKNTVVYHKQDGMESLQAEIQRWLPKESRMDKQKVVYAAAIGVAVLILIVVIALVFGGSDKKKESKEPPKAPQIVEPETNDNNIEDGNEDTQEPQTNEPDNNVVTEPDDTIQMNDSEYILPQSDTKELTREELLALSKEELRLARNEVFARHGMIFGDEELDNYFRSKSWYSPAFSVEEFYEKVEMSLVEERNVSLILEVENEKE